MSPSAKDRKTGVWTNIVTKIVLDRRAKRQFLFMNYQFFK